jgi:hypothetical protein
MLSLASRLSPRSSLGFSCLQSTPTPSKPHKTLPSLLFRRKYVAAPYARVNLTPKSQETTSDGIDNQITPIDAVSQELLDQLRSGNRRVLSKAITMGTNKHLVKLEHRILTYTQSKLTFLCSL